jgi:hypothetical protein
MSNSSLVLGILARSAVWIWAGLDAIDVDSVAHIRANVDMTRKPSIVVCPTAMAAAGSRPSLGLKRRESLDHHGIPVQEEREDQVSR